jgi:hypothetical protein
MLIIASVLLFLVFPLISCNDMVLKQPGLLVRGDINSPRTLPGVFMVEFSTAMRDHGKETILEHFKSNNAFSGFGNHKISFRTKTRTKLFHGHSFHVQGDFDESHLLKIPGAINVYRVGTFQLNHFIQQNKYL